MGGLPRRRAFGDGTLGSSRGRRHDREAERQVLSRSPHPGKASHEMTICSNSLARQLSLASSHPAKMATSYSAINTRERVVTETEAGVGTILLGNPAIRVIQLRLVIGAQ